MLDSDLAKLYQCTDGTKDDFYFQLTEEEKQELWFQTGTTKNMSRTNPHVFTEQGIYMLATILKSKVAREVSIAIMDTFTQMRYYINYNKDFLPHKFLLLEKGWWKYAKNK